MNEISEKRLNTRITNFSDQKSYPLAKLLKMATEVLLFDPGIEYGGYSNNMAWDIQRAYDYMNEEKEKRKSPPAIVIPFKQKKAPELQPRGLK